MKLLDRYIARQFLFNVVALFVILFCFVITIDASMNLHRFGRVAEELARQNGPAEDTPGAVRRGVVTLLVIADLWWPRLLQLYNFLLGLVMVGAMGFTCAQLVRNREFIAMLAAGQSLHRVARPILVVAVGLTALQAVNQELIIPRIAHLLTREHGEAGTRELGTASVRLTADGAGRLFWAGSFDADNEVLSNLFVIERSNGRLASRVITAESARWRDGGWDLTHGRVQARGSAAADTGEVDRIETNLDPTELKMQRFANYRQALSFSQTGEMLARPELLDEQARARLERIRYGRVAVMMTNILSLVIAMPFFITRVPLNMVQQSLKCAPISIAALIGGVLGASATIPGLPPAVGVFVPVMILLPAAIAMASSIRT